MTTDAATGVEEFYSLKQIQIVIRPRSYPLLCEFLMKITIVINLACACVKTSAEHDDFESLSKRERETMTMTMTIQKKIEFRPSAQSQGGDKILCMFILVRERERESG